MTINSGQVMIIAMLKLCLPSKLAIMVSVFAGLLGCQAQHRPQDSILVIAVDRLSNNFVSCGSDMSAEKSGFQRLCQTGLRFTHAFTPSVLTVPALASLLTSKIPPQTQVRNNRMGWLSEEQVTSAEVAVSRGFRTAFFSGGPPVWRRSGINQGFEIFDDNISVTEKGFFRLFEETNPLFQAWLKSDVDPQDAFFAIIHVSDLMYTQETLLKAGKSAQDVLHTARIENFDEQLSLLFENLDEMDRFDSTNIFLVGLNGPLKGFNEYRFPMTNLLNERSQIVFLLKPAQKKRDEGINWAVDFNVSLIDAGATIFDLLTDDFGLQTSSEVGQSLVALFRSNRNVVNKQSIIFGESGYWPESISCSARIDNITFECGETPRLFNDLIDRFQVSPLLGREPTTQKYIADFAKYLESAGYDSYTKSKNSFEIEIRSLLAKTEDRASAWKRAKAMKPGTVSADLLAIWAILLEDWDYLLTLGRTTQNQEWTYVARSNLPNFKEIHEPPSACFAVLNSNVSPKEVLSQYRTCKEMSALELLAWYFAMESKSEETDEYRDRFMRSYRYRILDRMIWLENERLYQEWGPLDKLGGYPTSLDLLLALPYFRKKIPAPKW